MKQGSLTYFWYLLISLKATVPGLYLCGFLTPPEAWGADFRAALVATICQPSTTCETRDIEHDGAMMRWWWGQSMCRPIREGRWKEGGRKGREMSLDLDLRCFLGALPPVDFRAVCYIVSKAVRNGGAVDSWEGR
jgi:hypothetical protein